MMFVTTSPSLFLAVVLSCFSQQDGQLVNSGARNTKDIVNAKAISSKDLRIALNSMIEGELFLANDAFLEPLRTKIHDENKKESLLRKTEIKQGDSISIGYWKGNLNNGQFSYVAKSADRSELYTIRGHCVFANNGQKTASLDEVSRTRLFHSFSKLDCEKIQLKMTKQEVTKIMRTMPGAYFAGEASFLYPDIRRLIRFVGTASECYKQLPDFFELQNDVTQKSFTQLAWISNDVAVWLSFDKEGKVERKTVTAVEVPNEPGDLEKNMLERLKEPR